MARAEDSTSISVNRDSEVPLGTQLGWKLRTLIATGALRPGARLPGVRELAESAQVNVNTVRSVYARLEEHGLIASEHGRGTFVAPGASRRAELARVANAAAAEARGAGVELQELAAALFVTNDPAALPSDPVPDEDDDDDRELPPGATGAGEPQRRRQLRQQIAQLERDLVHSQMSPATHARPRAAAGRILNAAELESVRDELAERVEQLRQARVEARLRAQAPPEPARAPAPKVWRHAGVWTGRAGVARTASYGI